MGLSGLPWPVRVIGHDSAGAGSTSGVLAGVAGRGTRCSGPSCSAVIDGTSPARETGEPVSPTSTTGELHDQGSGDLHFYNVRGRNGHLNNGDSMTFPATLLIKAGGSHDINIITSP